MQKRVESSGADSITVSLLFLHDAQAEEGLDRGMVEDVHSHEAGQEEIVYACDRAKSYGTAAPSPA